MNFDPLMILYGFCFGAVFWASCRAVGYAVQSTRISFDLSD